MELGEDKLHSTHTVIFMFIDGHAASVVLNRETAVAMQRYANLIRMADDCFVDAIVDDFMGKMVGSVGLCIHAGALSHRLQSGQYF